MILRRSVFAIDDENYESLCGAPNSDAEIVLAGALIKNIEDKNFFSNFKVMNKRLNYKFSHLGHMRFRQIARGRLKIKKSY